MKSETRDALARPFGPEAVRQKKGQGNRLMDYVSHGMVTKRLNDAAPDWSAEMIERWITDMNGALHCVGGVMRMTIDGVTREEAGGPTRLGTLADDLKNTYSDCLKRCAMRFGVALDMWESAEENDEDAQPAPPPANQSTRASTPPARRSASPDPRPAAAPTAAGQPLAGTALLDIIRDDQADPKERRRALHNYLAGASSSADLNQRADAVASSGMPKTDRDAGYRFHLARLSTATIMEPASKAG